MNEKKLISSYIDNNKLNIEQVMIDFTPYLYTIIKNKSTNFLSEDIEEIISDVFCILWKKNDFYKEQSIHKLANMKKKKHMKKPNGYLKNPKNPI